MAERFRTASSGSLFIDAPTLGAKTVLFVALAIVASASQASSGNVPPALSLRRGAGEPG